MYWGDVGPDAGTDSVGVGPAAEDEYNVAMAPGNFGWPYFVGDNRAYSDLDFATNRSGPPFDPAHPVNNSPNNTGLQSLPPARPALIGYPAAETKKYPIMGSGGRSAMAGPTYYPIDFTNAKRPFPAYYAGKTFLYEWMRDMILAVSVSNKGTMTNMERFLPGLPLSHPIDMAFGPNGDLYVLEYGTGWFAQNDDSRLVRIEYNAGNRRPNVKIAADQWAGAVPLKVKLSSVGTTDFDGDILTYQWTVFDKMGNKPVVLNGQNPTFIFKKPGQYKARLTVTDAHGLIGSRELNILAGNQPPRVALTVMKGNQSFYFPNQPIAYRVSVTDREDGSLADGKIAAKQVQVQATYQTEVAASDDAGHHFAEAAYLGAGQGLLEKSDCKACHQTEKKSVGPAFAAIARRYRGDNNVVVSLSNKIIKGGGGNWGDAIMTAHPQLTPANAGEMVKYILSLADRKLNSLPVAGTYRPGKNETGNLVLRATYTDKGAGVLPGQSSQQTLVLRHPLLVLGTSDQQSKGVMLYKMGGQPYAFIVAMASDSYVQFNQLDLTGIRRMDIAVAVPKKQLSAVGGRIEVRADSPTGPLLGQTAMILPNDNPDPAAMFNPDVVEVPLTPTTGRHDLYFVFRNEKAGKAPLFVAVTVQLIN